jgi:CRP/FNR family cyclic AMP-dependent transcriptional regulator
MKQTDAEVIDALKRVHLFDDLPDKTLKVVASQVRRFDYSSGDLVIEEEASGKFGRMYVILSGTADAKTNDETIASLGPGDLFGEMSMLDGGPRSATIVATSELSTIGLSSWNVRALLRENPDLALHIIHVLATRLRAANARSLD